MGAFDTFVATAKCPYCGEEKEFGFQTKHFIDDDYHAWKVGDSLYEDEQIAFCIAGHDCGELTDHFYRVIKDKNGKVVRTLVDQKTKHRLNFYGTAIIKDGKFVGIKEISKNDDGEDLKYDF